MLYNTKPKIHNTYSVSSHGFKMKNGWKGLWVNIGLNKRTGWGSDGQLRVMLRVGNKKIERPMKTKVNPNALIISVQQFGS